MNRKGADKVLSIYWFLILFIVAGGIVYIAYLFYSSPYDVRNVESQLLGDQIANCVTNNGYLGDSFLNLPPDANLINLCHLNFNVEDVFGWGSQTQYYAELQLYKFSSALPGLTGDEVFSTSVGNPNLKTEWELTLPQQSVKRNVNTIVIHSTEGADAAGAIETISDSGVSIHYMIDRDGTVISASNENSFAPSQYANAFKSESDIAQHAGCFNTRTNQQLPPCSSSCIDSNGLLATSCQNLNNPPQSEWCCINTFNPISIGIELVNLGPLCSQDSFKDSSYCKDAVSSGGSLWEPFSTAQINSLVNLVSDISSRYNIPIDRTHIIGHYQITTYKTDPGPAFPWDSFIQQLQARGSVTSSTTSLNQGEQERSFYVLDKSGNSYVVKILALVGKKEKNEA